MPPGEEPIRKMSIGNKKEAPRSAPVRITVDVIAERIAGDRAAVLEVGRVLVRGTLPLLQ